MYSPTPSLRVIESDSAMLQQSDPKNPRARPLPINAKSIPVGAHRIGWAGWRADRVLGRREVFVSCGGHRQCFTPAHDPDQPVGKILRLTLDGKPAPGNPNYGKTGAAMIPLIDPAPDWPG